MNAELTYNRQIQHFGLFINVNLSLSWILENISQLFIYSEMHKRLPELLFKVEINQMVKIDYIPERGDFIFTRIFYGGEQTENQHLFSRIKASGLSGIFSVTPNTPKNEL